MQIFFFMENTLKRAVWKKAAQLFQVKEIIFTDRQRKGLQEPASGFLLFQ
jgi:hypothetical protein